MKVILSILFISFTLNLTAQIVGTFAGTRDSAGYQDGQGGDAIFNNPHGLAISKQGNIYVCDRFNHIIRKISPEGIVSTLAGNPGNLGDIDGQGTTARFYEPWGICVDANENVFVADTRNNKIKKITPDGTVSTFAGTGNYGTTDGPANASTFGQPVGIEITAQGILYIADHSTHVIRRVDSGGSVTTIAGSPFLLGDVDGTGSEARFYRPYGLTIDLNGDILVTDEWNHKLKRVTPEGVVTTVAGLGTPGAVDGSIEEASFNFPWDVAVDSSGRIYVADGLNYTIRRIDNGNTPAVTTYAGSTGVLGSADGLGSTARFVSTTGIAFSPLTKELYVGDAYNNLVRKITDLTLGVVVSAGFNFTSACPEDEITFTGFPDVFEEYDFYLDGTLVKSSPETWLDTTGLIAGLHEIKVIVRYDTLEMESEPLEFEIFEVAPVTIDTIGETTFFEGDSVTLISSFGTEYFWSNGEVTPTLTIFESGNFNVETTDPNGCVDVSENVEITVFLDLDPIVVEADGPLVYCSSDVTTLQTNYTQNIQWIKDGWPIEGAIDTVFHALESGSYQVQHTSESGTIIISESVEIEVSPGPALDFRSDRRLIKPGMEVNFVSLNSELSAVRWDFGDAASMNNQSTDLEPRHRYEQEGFYTVTFIGHDQNGCVDTLRMADFIEVSNAANLEEDTDDVFIATAFTPNNDGLNDNLFVLGTDVAEMDFKVFNQWGQLIFQSDTQQNGWDGYFKNKKVPLGNYSYLLEYTNWLGIKKQRSGKVTILK